MKPQSCRQQNGQALAEALLICGGLVVLVLAMGWLYRAHSLAVSAQHASAHAAFMATRQGANTIAASGLGPEGESNLSASFVQGLGRSWAGTGALLHVDQTYSMPQLQQAQPSALMRYQLAHQWGTDHRLVHQAQVQFRLPVPFAGAGTTAANVFSSSGVNLAALRLGRHTAILLNAGHASSDAQTQQRLAESELGWGQAATKSYGLSNAIHQAVAGTDAAWNRPLALSEWLSHWGTSVPRSKLGSQP